MPRTSLTCLVTDETCTRKREKQQKNVNKLWFRTVSSFEKATVIFNAFLVLMRGGKR